MLNNTSLADLESTDKSKEWLYSSNTLGDRNFESLEGFVLLERVLPVIVGGQEYTAQQMRKILSAPTKHKTLQSITRSGI